MLERALKSIPLASQTFSKSLVQFPVGAAPMFIERGQGSSVWDADGNQYVDYINGLLCVLLGYRDRDVDAAVAHQLTQGVSFSLPHRLEMEVAERIIDLVPCAEMVRFGKNGSDATAGAIRLARGYTGRDHVAVCGYHGWQDWYIGSTTRNLGVPDAARRLTHSFAYNDLPSLEAVFASHPDSIAAVILEPMNVEYPERGFLEGVKALTHANGAVLIFDEIITGFRFANGGAQELFGVVPDLAALGKGLGNGFPISAVVGRRDIMKLMEEVFFSFTFGGETVSLAAACAVLDKLRAQPVVETLRRRGEKLMSGVRRLIERHAVADVFAVHGAPAWSFLTIADARGYTEWDIKTFVFQEMFRRGMLMFGSHNMSYAHSDEDIDALLKAYDEILPEVNEALSRGDLLNRLHCEPLRPLFRVR
jgi:glutamate-1-semialdehyde 2,1-aminomutase